MHKILKPVPETIFSLCDLIRQTSFEIHSFLKNGHLEKVYENALIHRLTTKGLEVQQQCPLKVYDKDGTSLGEFFADLVVNRRIVVEVKAAETIVSEHIAQLLGYLRACRMEHGLLINFGNRKLQIKKYIMTDHFFKADDGMKLCERDVCL